MIQPSKLHDPSSRLLEQIFENMHVAVAYLDREFNFLRVNRAYALADDRDPGFFPGKNHFDLYPDAENKAIFQNVVDAGAPFYAFGKPFEYNEHPERGVTYWDWSLQPIKDEAGAVQSLLLMLEDVTQREQSLKVLRESQALLEHLFLSNPDGNILVDQQGQILSANPQIEALFGYSSAELIGRRIELLIPERYHHDHQADRSGYVIRPRTRTMGAGLDLFGRRKDGSEFPVDVTLSPLDTDHGLVVLAVVRDITQRRRAEQALKESEERFRLAADQFPYGFVLYDGQGRIQYANAYAVRITGYTQEEMLGHTDDEILPPETVNGYLPMLRQAIATGTPQSGECTIQFGGQVYTTQVSFVPLLKENGQIRQILGISYDLTERKRIEAELAEVQRRLMESFEVERKRMAQELHDGPIQDLYAADFQLHIIREESADDAQRDALAEVQATLHRTVEMLRDVCSELRPQSLGKFGLAKAIRSYAEQFQQKYPGLRVDLELDDDKERLPEAMRMALYRNLQQLLSNVARHAQASQVRIDFSCRNGRVAMIVQDNGCGFQQPLHWVDLARQGHLGLIGCSERMEAFNGTFEIQSEPGKGTTVQSTVPLS